MAYLKAVFETGRDAANQSGYLSDVPDAKRRPHYPKGRTPMTTAIHLATSDDAPRLLTLIAAFHAECGIERSDEQREAALMPLLQGSPLGAAWLFGPAKAPTGYTIITFGWSMEMGGMDAFIDELFIRPSVRKRGIASEVLMAISSSLAGVDVKALHLEVDRSDDATQRLYTRAHFKLRDTYSLMTRLL